jgi:RimJ/RimL family protein N-acetyltransferase
MQILKLTKDHFELLCNLFSDIVRLGEDKIFHPHEFTNRCAKKICRYNEYNVKDSYYIILNNEQNDIIAYGWGEGYDIPCLGIYINEKYRGQGFSKFFMKFLHLSSKEKGAKQVRLKVYKDNLPAVMLYKACGYELSDYDDEQYIGFITV